ncbi:uncharacterized protein [Prorops nasuta]|uniref:uncharacterized protein n=1 Tax=Prorops nasuta TaxID=863751 RepID=UPI0034CD953D
MAGLQFSALALLCLFSTYYFVGAASGPTAIPLENVNSELIQSAINALNQDSPTHHKYKGGNLISAQKVIEPPNAVYRLTLNLHPTCETTADSCPWEACTINLVQNEQKLITVQRDSIQCMYVYPQFTQDEVEQKHETIQHNSSQEEQELIKNIQKQIITNQSFQLDHEVQTTGDQNEKPFIAVRVTEANSCPGCPYELNPTLPGLAVFCDEAIQFIDEQTDTDFKHKVVRVINATRTIPVGSNVVRFQLLLEIGETNCLKNTLTERSDCTLEANIPHKFCSLTYDQEPWQNNSRRITKNNCTTTQSAATDVYSNIKLLNNNESSPEKYSEVEIKVSNNEAVKNFAFTNGETPVTEQPFKKVIVEKNSDDEKPQGFINKQKEFDEFLKNFELPIETDNKNANPSSILVKIDNVEDKTGSRIQRSANGNEESGNTRKDHIVGAPNEVSVEDATVKEYVTLGLNKISQVSDAENEPILVQVKKATRQVVAGSLFKIIVDIGTSTCVKGTTDNCQLKSNSTIKECEISVWSRPWIDKGTPEVTVKCKANSRTTRSAISKEDADFLTNLLIGAPNKISIEDAKVKEYAELGLKEISKISVEYEPILVKIKGATMQIVTGTLYRIIVEIGTSTCVKGAIDNCQLKPDSKIEEYEITAWSRPWVDNGSPAVKVNCRLNSRTKRSAISKDSGELNNNRFVGAPSEISVEDATVKEYAGLGLKEISKISLEYEPILVKIKGATVQIVAGTLHKIIVDIGTSTCVKGTTENCQLKPDSKIEEYEISVWSRPWIDHGSPVVTVKSRLNSRTKKSVNGIDASSYVQTDQIVGAPNEISVEDATVKEYAELGLKEISKISLEYEPILVKIKGATVQIVAGTLHKIIVDIGTSTCVKGTKDNCRLKPDSSIEEYEISVWSRPWIDHGSPTVTVKSRQNSRIRKSANGIEVSGYTKKTQLAGAPNEISVEDATVKEYADLGLKKISQVSDREYEPIIVQIKKATSQVVAGILYKIIVDIGTSTCVKGTTDNCRLKPDSTIEEYEISVWSRPWIDHGSPTVTVKSRLNSRTRKSANGIEVSGYTKKTQLVGAPNEISVDDATVKEYAKLGLKKISQVSDREYEPIIVQIKKATSQVVAGILYKIVVDVGTSTCIKGTTENCNLKPDSIIEECEISVWSRPWVNNGSSDVTVKCKTFREKRSLRGRDYTRKMLEIAEELAHSRLFEDFIIKYNKTYETTQEKEDRFKVFRNNLKIIENLRNNEQATAEYGITMFADIAPEEFRAKYMGLRPELRKENEIPMLNAEIPNVQLPNEFDWRHYNVVTPVKNQGACGSCWAFAVTGNVEGQYAIKHKQLVSLSEQELIDCDKLDAGCNGGLPDSAYRAIENLGGLELESDYPYEAENDKCHLNKNKLKVRVVSAVNITSNETKMAQWLVNNGPIAIGINANAMQFYVGGVSHPYKFLCSPKNLDHGVLIVGYGVKSYPLFNKTIPYWIIKNSWGPSWGEQGYYRVYRGDGTCGLNTMASSAIVA